MDLAQVKSSHSAQVDEQVDQRVGIGNGSLVAQFRPLNAKVDGLTEDSLRRRALPIDLLIFIAFAVELIANARSLGGGHDHFAATTRPFVMANRAGCASCFWMM